MSYEAEAESHRSRIATDASVREAYVRPGYDAKGRACFHVFYRPRFQVGRYPNGRRVRWEYRA